MPDSSFVITVAIVFFEKLSISVLLVLHEPRLNLGFSKKISQALKNVSFPESQLQSFLCRAVTVRVTGFCD